MGSKRKYWIMIILVTVSLTVGIVAGILISGQSFTRKLFFSKDNKVDTILDIINEEYVDSVYIKDLIEKAIPHIINELDPHSSYITKKEALGYTESMEGAFGGIGAALGFYDPADTLIIARITPGSPAEQAGLLAGDRIVMINDTSYLELDLPYEEVLERVRGSIGTPVKIAIRRPGSDSEQLIPFLITREQISIETVVAAYEVEKGIGLIKLFDTFTHKTYDEFINALAKLKANGCTDFIIDLRGNGGGSLDAALNIANEFLDVGRLIMYSEGKAFPGDQVYANGTGSLQDGQVIVLMDQLSASASEILAGAIQDNDRGLIMGQRSYGKGLIQNHIELMDGSALRLTVARYYTPSGRNIQRPYELGKSKEYNQEWVDKFLGGESFHADSIKVDSTLLYTTLRGRTVYGGGGIIPDVFIPVDTTSLTTYYMQLQNQDIFSQFAFSYVDSNREALKEFKTYPEMLAYLEERPILWEIARYAESKGIRRRSHLIYKSSAQILSTTHAYILRDFFGDNAFYPVHMSNDRIISIAIEAIQEGLALPHNIVEGKHKEINIR